MGEETSANTHVGGVGRIVVDHVPVARLDGDQILMRTQEAAKKEERESEGSSLSVRMKRLFACRRVWSGLGKNGEERMRCRLRLRYRWVGRRDVVDARQHDRESDVRLEPIHCVALLHLREKRGTSIRCRTRRRHPSSDASRRSSERYAGGEEEAG